MASPLSPLTQRDFSGGVNAAASPHLVGEKQVTRCTNMLLDEHGALTTRDGFTILSSGADARYPLVYRAILTKADQTTFPFVIQADTNLNFNRVWKTDTDPWLIAHDFTTLHRTPQSVTAFDTEVIANGYERLVRYNGTTFTQVTPMGGQAGLPGAQHIAFHLGSIWAWNTAAATTTLDGRSSLRMSDPVDIQSWPDANQVFIDRDDGQEGTGLASFTIAETGVAPIPTLIAFKNYAGYQITGVIGSSDFAVQKLKSDMGCTAGRTIQFIAGFGLIRLTHRGFALYNGVDDRLISEEIRPYIFGHDDITGINFTEAKLSWASQSSNPPLYICSCPVVGTELTRTFIYDLVRRSWTIAEFPIGFQTMALVTAPGTNPTVQVGTSRAGQLLTIFNGARTDNGVAIPWNFRTKEFSAGTPMRNAYWRRLVLDVEYSPTQAITATVQVRNQPAKTLTSSLTTITPSTGDEEWGTFVWGEDVWSGVGIDVNREERAVSMDIMQQGPAANAVVSGVGYVRIRGLEWQARSKPLNKLSR